tara:strand:+ start:17 stop:880 length:864 start_codon:yes stop_codon:yes gene_type:complete
MKVNKKALELIDKGLSANTVGKLTESQINTLHSKLFTEVTMVSKDDSGTINTLKTQKKPFEVYEKDGEVKETDDVEVTTDPNKEIETQDPKQVGPSSDDGFGDETDGMGMFESEADLKPGQPNPWAICHAQVGPKKTRKFERCVKSVKKQLEEGKNPVSLFIETEIMKIVERNLLPRITKGDLLKYLSEAPTEAPTKPITKPDTKPTTRPSHPGKNPRPGEQIDPKAGEPTTAPTKPITKPGTKPTTRPAHPGKNPRPGEQIDPKAGRISPEDAKQEVIDVILNLLK